MTHSQRLSIRTLLLASVLILSSFTASQARHFNASTPDTMVCSTGDSTYGATTLRSIINDSLTVYAIITGTDAAYFELGSSSAFIPADSLYTGLWIKFKPTSSRAYTAILTLTDGDTTIHYQLTGVGRDAQDQELLMSSVNLSAGIGSTNCGYVAFISNAHSSVIIDSFTITGASSASMSTSFNHTLPYTMPNIAQEYVQLCFSPTNYDNSTDTLTISYRMGGTPYRTSRTFHTLAYAAGTCLNVEGDTTLLDTVAFQSFALIPLQARNLMPHRASLVSILLSDSTHWTVDSVGNYTHPNPAQTFGFLIGFHSWVDSNVTTSTTQMAITMRDDSTQATCTKYVQLTAYIHTPLSPPNDTTYLQISPDTTETLALDSHHSVRIFSIANNTGSAMKVDTAYLGSGAHFSLEKLAPDSDYVFYLPAGASMVFRITLLDTAHAYDDTLYVVTEHGIVAYTFPITSRSGALSAVREQSLPLVRISISPNPSHGEATLYLEGAKSAHVELMDILGRQVSISQNVPSGNSGLRIEGLSELSAGSYIARVSGVGIDGRPFVSSERLLLER